jgi:hypothetical protein
MTRKRRSTRVTSVNALLPGSIELTKLKSGNGLEIQVRSHHVLLGTLNMGRGSVEWWPGGNKIYSLRKSWQDFAEMLEKHMR